jgi:UDP-N-acetylglucosamine acyltransferase
MIHRTAIIYDNVTISDNVSIGAGAIIGCPPEHKSYLGKPYKGVYIGENTHIGEGVVIGGGTETDTIIGKNCYIQAGAHISHDCHIGDNVTLAMKVVLCGNVYVFDWANLGASSSVKQHKVVGPGVMLGMNACAVTNLEPFCTYAGVPAKIKGQNVIGLERCKLYDDEISQLVLAFKALCKTRPL